MKILKGNLPDALYEAIVRTNSKYTKGNADYSTTELIDSPRIAQLKRKHWDEIEENAEDMLWRFFGHISHEVLANTSDWNVLKEERMYAILENKTISGCPDLFDGNKVTDYKITSIYKVKNGVDESWEQQLNIYRYILVNNGWQPKELEIVAICRDAHVGDSKVVMLPVAMWDMAKAESYLRGRIQAHTEAFITLPLCTEDERWYTERKYAVMKTGNKRALKLFSLKVEANLYLKKIQEKEKKLIYIDERPGISKRCEKYCVVSRFCDQFKQEQSLGNTVSTG